MKQLKILSMVLLLLITAGTYAQEAGAGYDPFVPANLDDPVKLPEVPVVESSYHYYSVLGDANFAQSSTFVWYVENGTLGTYDAVNDVWTPMTGTTAHGSGELIEILGVNNGTTDNTSAVWVRWNDGTGGTTGYIAVYERSADNCVFENQITGYKHQILVPPEIWFLADAREECSDQLYSVSAQFNEVHDNSFPYTLTYTYPGADGVMVQRDTIIESTDLDAGGLLTWDLEAVQDLDVTTDEVYTITLDELRDRFGSLGKIAPLGATAGQYDQISITIFHLPQTGGMIMY